jgi:hypothetical protein
MTPFFTPFRDLLHVAWLGADGFTSLPKEDMLRISFMPTKVIKK